MNRRAFLAWLGGTAAGAALLPTLDLDKLLWVPGNGTLFSPTNDLATMYMHGRLNEGDILTIDGWYEMNPKTRRRVDNLQRWLVTADATSSGAMLTPLMSPA